MANSAIDGETLNDSPRRGTTTITELMARISRLELYTTDGCRLCDEAERILDPVIRRLGIELEARDVLDDEGWETAYAERIPVVRRPDTGAELGWPFDTDSLYRFLL
ncbi:glutaredoxin family protein [Arhodomonas sp. AD133]|uniref:glutaredoxin family protein n=1 Tax=Arhodomonas sp. AD133 TaxID=3415009 RepID=UPI003EB6D9DB